MQLASSASCKPATQPRSHVQKKNPARGATGGGVSAFGPQGREGYRSRRMSCLNLCAHKVKLSPRYPTQGAQKITVTAPTARRAVWPTFDIVSRCGGKLPSILDYRCRRHVLRCRARSPNILAICRYIPARRASLTGGSAIGLSAIGAWLGVAAGDGVGCAHSLWLPSESSDVQRSGYTSGTNTGAEPVNVSGRQGTALKWTERSPQPLARFLCCAACRAT